MDSLINYLENCSLKTKINDLNEEIKELVVNEMIFKLDEIMKKWSDTHSNNYTGGKMRCDRGEDIETFVRHCIEFIAENEGINLVAKRGETDFKVLTINEVKKDHQVDIHVYLDDTFIAVIECKAYIDHCMYVRACDDFKIFKEFGYSVKNMVFAMEDAMKDESKIFTDHVNHGICDKCFFILDGKRSSAKPVYDQRFKKDINKDKVKAFIDYLFLLIKK